jgi:hypothetical protein
MKNIVIILLCMILLFSCNGKIQRIIERQNELVSICQNKSYGYRSHIYFLSTYKDSLENQYFFRLLDTKIIFDTCYIQFMPDTELRIFENPNQSDKSKKNLYQYLIKLKTEMDLLDINGFGQIKTNNQLDKGLIFFLQNGKILEYRPKRIYKIDDYKKVSEHWYLYNATAQ